MDIKDAFAEILTWLSQAEEDEKIDEEFYSWSHGYTLEDVANLLDETKEFYERMYS